MGGTVLTWCLGVRERGFFPLAGREQKLGGLSWELTTLSHLNAQPISHSSDSGSYFQTSGTPCESILCVWSTYHLGTCKDLCFSDVGLFLCSASFSGLWTTFFLLLPLDFGLHLFSAPA